MTLDQAIAEGDAVYSHDHPDHGGEIFRTKCYTCGAWWMQEPGVTYETECPSCAYAPAFSKPGGSHFNA